jgi:PPOX class probable F420-dependent enzyme
MEKIPAGFSDLLKDETRAFAFLATTMKDGSPQVTPVWFDSDDEYLRVNSAQGRTKDRNMRARPKVALAIVDPTNAYRYIQILGRVVEILLDKNNAHIDRLAGKYTGTPKYQFIKPGDVRVTYKILPEKVTTNG